MGLFDVFKKKGSKNQKNCTLVHLVKEDCGNIGNGISCFNFVSVKIVYAGDKSDNKSDYRENADLLHRLLKHCQKVFI